MTTATIDMAKPLAGKRVIVSRAKAQAGALSSRLRDLGADVLEIPFIEIRPPADFAPLDAALKNRGQYHWLILTSANGVRALCERLPRLGLTRSDLGHMRVAAIGPATRNSIEQRGFHVEVVPAEYVAEAVVSSLREHVTGQNILLVRAKVARDVIPNELRKVAARVDVIEAYETVLPESSREQLTAALKDDDQRPDVITFTSSSTAKNFVELVGSEVAYSGLLDGVNLASIGPITTATLEQFNLPPTIKATEYTVIGLVDAIVRYFQPR